METIGKFLSVCGLLETFPAYLQGMETFLPELFLLRKSRSQPTYKGWKHAWD